MRRRDYRSLLMKWFRSPSIERKEEAFDKLSLLPEKDRVEVLFMLLEDPSWYLRENAAERIVAYGDEVVERLLNLLRSGVWFTRAASAIALGEIGSERGVKPLIEVFKKDRNRTVIKEATRAIAQILIKNRRDISYLDQFGIKLDFIERLDEHGNEFRGKLGLRSD